MEEEVMTNNVALENTKCVFLQSNKGQREIIPKYICFTFNHCV
jgi:hypothetical protein